MASLSASAVAAQFVPSIGYWPSAHKMSSDLPCGPVIAVTTVFNAAATLLHSAPPPLTESTASPPSSSHSTAGAPSSHAWITLFSKFTCLLQLESVPNAIKFRLYLVTHLPSVSKNIVVGVLVSVVVVVGVDVAVVVVVCDVVPVVLVVGVVVVVAVVVVVGLDV